MERLADNVAAAHTGDGKRDLAVVHENAGAGRDILRKAREGHLHSRLVAIAGRGAEGEFLALPEHGLAAAEFAEAYLRPLGVEHNGGVQPCFRRSSFTRSMRALWSACVPCEKLNRAQSMPESMSCSRTPAPSEAGP